MDQTLFFKLAAATIPNAARPNKIDPFELVSVRALCGTVAPSNGTGEPG
jgi:hypothetical protein